jgi:hypothetical protein
VHQVPLVFDSTPKKPVHPKPHYTAFEMGFQRTLCYILPQDIKSDALPFLSIEKSIQLKKKIQQRTHADGDVPLKREITLAGFSVCTGLYGLSSF